MLIDGILATLVVFLVLELLICITAMLFGLTVLAARRTQVVTSRGLPFRRHLLLRTFTFRNRQTPPTIRLLFFIFLVV